VLFNLALPTQLCVQCTKKRVKLAGIPGRRALHITKMTLFPVFFVSDPFSYRPRFGVGPVLVLDQGGRNETNLRLRQEGRGLLSI